MDCGRLFDSLKAGVKSINKLGSNVRNSTLRQNMEKALDEFSREFNIDLRLMKEKIIYGHEVAIAACQKHWTSHKMRESSAVAGNHTDKEIEGGDTADYHRVMTRTMNVTATGSQLRHMYENRNIVDQHFKENGINDYVIILKYT